MRTIFFPILCVSGNQEISVNDYETRNKNVVWDHCYRMMQFMAPRILGFKIYRVDRPITSPVDDEQIEMIDAIMQLLKDLDMRHVKKYNYDDLMKYDKGALQLVLDTLTDQYSAMMN